MRLALKRSISIVVVPPFKSHFVMTQAEVFSFETPSVWIPFLGGNRIPPPYTPLAQSLCRTPCPYSLPLWPPTRPLAPLPSPLVPFGPRPKAARRAGAQQAVCHAASDGEQLGAEAMAQTPIGPAKNHCER